MLERLRGLKHSQDCSLGSLLIVHVPEQMELGLQSCSTQGSSTVMYNSYHIPSALWLMNLYVSYFYFPFVKSEFDILENIFLLGTESNRKSRSKSSVYSLYTAKSNFFIVINAGGVE